MGAGATTAGRLAGREAAGARRSLAADVSRRLTGCILLAHAIGIADVVLLLLFVLPTPVAQATVDDAMAANAIALAIYVPLSAAVGIWLGRRLTLSRTAWAREDRDPDPEERAMVLRLPARAFKYDAGGWLCAAVLFLAVNAPYSFTLACHVAWTIFLGGVTTCAIANLVMERQLRPITDLALAAGPPARPAWPGVEGRLVLAWLLATGAPLLGIASLGFEQGDATVEELRRSAVVLGVAAFGIGLTVTLVVARSVSRPLTGVRRALGRVQAGDLSADVRVDDGSEVGLLQSGFNSMVAGLRERERTRELLARTVGADVAREALADEPRLGGGQVQEVAVLFVDMVGSTALALEAPPERVVARLNGFFALVVEVVAAHGGWVNKFEGDAALAVFGAPNALEDPAGCALRAGRELARRLDETGVAAGIGLSAGPAVAGWVGAEQRFEYTVIGDPVNVAARLCELAKRRPSRLLAAEAILDRAEPEEAARWAVGEAVTLRGRSEPTRLGSPA